MLESLQSAEGWGVADILGGGLIVTAAKHSHMDDARGHANRAHAALRRFRRELGDVPLEANLQVEISSFLTFSDYFFDGLIVDWAVQSRLNEAVSRTRAALTRVNRVLDRLWRSRAALQKDLEAVRADLGTRIGSPPS